MAEDEPLEAISPDAPEKKSTRTKGACIAILKHFGIHTGAAGIIATFVWGYLAEQREATNTHRKHMQAMQEDLITIKAKMEADERQDEILQDLQTRVPKLEQTTAGLRRTTGAQWEVMRQDRERLNATDVTAQTNERLIDHMYKHRMSKQPETKQREAGIADKINDFWNGKKKKIGTAKVPRKVNTKDLRQQAEQNYSNMMRQ